MEDGMWINQLLNEFFNKASSLKCYVNLPKPISKEPCLSKVTTLMKQASLTTTSQNPRTAITNYLPNITHHSSWSFIFNSIDLFQICSIIFHTYIPVLLIISQFTHNISQYSGFQNRLSYIKKIKLNQNNIWTTIKIQTKSKEKMSNKGLQKLLENKLKLQLEPVE